MSMRRSWWRRGQMALWVGVGVLATQSLFSSGTAPAGATIPLVKPPVPSGSIYLGAWVNPDKSARSTASELSQLPAFNKQLGRNLAIVHVYQQWTTPTSLSDLNQIATTGAVPLISWYCGDTDANVVAGLDDAVITTFARELKTYAGPVFLRWYWEPNFPSGPNGSRCLGTGVGGGASGYVAAFQHIHRLFVKAGASNVAFVWAMGTSGANDWTDYYPGNAYVDWISADGYDKDPAGVPASQAFTYQFKTFKGGFYPAFATPTYGKPILIGEMGAQASNGDQTPYVHSLPSALENTFPDIKGIVYFDGGLTPYDWTLQGTGLTAFDQMAQLPYFSATG